MSIPTQTLSPSLLAGLALFVSACADTGSLPELEAAETGDLELLDTSGDDAVDGAGDPGWLPLPQLDDSGSDSADVDGLVAPTEPDDPLEVADETLYAYEGVQRVTDFYLNPLYAEVAWASPDTPTCSATMIGPNLLMQAAHCGADDSPSMTVKGRVYRERDLAQKFEESFHCELLFHTAKETDMAIYHCPPEPGELSLGDRFGWIDIDPTEAQEGQMLFSVFSNPLDSFAPGVEQHLFTWGPVTNTNVEDHWANPNDPQGSVIVQPDQGVNQIQEVVRTSLWCNEGASGSAQFDLTTGKIVIGPLSTGPLDGLGRYALGIRDYLYYGWIYERQTTGCPWKPVLEPNECKSDNSVHGDYVTSLGLDPTDYEDAYADQDLDWFFDLPADVSDLEGENARAFYQLRFSSRRQNRLWTAGPASSIDDDPGRLAFDVYDAGMASQWVELARHDRLNLEPDTDYTVSFSLDSETGYYRVCTEDATTVCSPWFFDDEDTERTHTFRVQSALGDPALVIEGWSAIGEIGAVSVAKTTIYPVSGGFGQPFVFGRRVINDFDSFDERNAWYNPFNGSRARILPDGEQAGVDWAGRLHKVGGSTGIKYDQATDSLPFVPSNDTHTLCWAHRRDPSETWNSALGYLRVERQDGTHVADALFSPTDDWDETCHEFSANVSTGEALRVKFGIFGMGTHSAAAFIDGVEVRLPND